MYNNPYEILGVSKEASLEEIKKKYRELAMQYHPDINPTAEAAEKMKQINAAFENIKNSKNVTTENTYNETNYDYGQESARANSDYDQEADKASWQKWREKRDKAEERRNKEAEYYRVKASYRDLTMLHEAITSQLASKKYKNNFLGRLDKVIMEYINLANQNKEIYFARDEYISKMKSIEEQFKPLLLAQLDKINTEELTLEVQANKYYIEFYHVTFNNLEKISITYWATLMSYEIFKWLDLDDNIRDVYNIARAKFMSEYGVDEEAMSKIDYTVHKNLANYVNEHSLNYDETLEQIEKNVDVFLREAYTYYMTNIEDDNLKR